MSEFTSTEKMLDRRGFLKGSAIFAAAMGLAVAAPALAQDAQKPAEPATEPAGEKKAEPAKKKLLDSQGREYRVCDMCGGNMYKAENTWTCEQCGFSYEE
jgi:anaerobic selenocysteine-containing dehydrogenase